MGWRPILAHKCGDFDLFLALTGKLGRTLPHLWARQKAILVQDIHVYGFGHYDHNKIVAGKKI